MAEDTLQRIKLVNQEIEDWSTMTNRELLMSIQNLGIRDKGLLAKSVKNRVGYTYGVAEKVSIKLNRYGIFVEKGVGRGTKIDQVGQTNRVAKRWLSPVLDKHTPKLADKVAKIFAESSVNAIKL